MLWSKKSLSVAKPEADIVVSKTFEVYVRFNEELQLIKPRSSLPYSWFDTREAFLSAYKKEFRLLSKDLHNSYQHIYTELAFFVDDDVCIEFYKSLKIAIKCRIELMQKIGMSESEAFASQMIASSTVKAMSREDIVSRLANEKTCPQKDLDVLSKTLSFCGDLYRVMFDEWVAHVNLFAG